MSPTVYAASQAACIPLTDVGINVHISLESLAFMQRKTGCLVKKGGGVSFLLECMELGTIAPSFTALLTGSREPITHRPLGDLKPPAGV